jgi:AcrR family transcriptional regulator
VRAVAAEAGTTTRAVHSLFGSKEGLLIDALAESAFDFVADNIAALDVTGDPVDDLVAVGVPVFRSLTLDHPALSRKRAFWAASRSRRRRWRTTRCWKVSPMPSCAVACYRTFPLAPRSTPGVTRSLP